MGEALRRSWERRGAAGLGSGAMEGSTCVSMQHTTSQWLARRPAVSTAESFFQHRWSPKFSSGVKCTNESLEESS